MFVIWEHIYKQPPTVFYQEVSKMKKIIMIVMLALAVMSLISTVVMAGAGDENYFGEDGDQPATGAEDSPGDGLPSDDVPDTGATDRTRNKDN